MTQFADTPQQILLNNRTAAPTLELLFAQVNSLARMMEDARNSIAQGAATTASLAAAQTLPAATLPVRALDTDFVISAERSALVFYTVELTVTATFLGLSVSAADVMLMIDGIATGDSAHTMTVSLALTTSVTHTHRKMCVGFVPRGATVNLTSSGTGAKTLVTSMEVLL